MDTILSKILVVDDEEPNRRNIKKMLTRVGYDVMTAENAEEALWKIENYSFALVILDIVMPDQTGKLSKRAGVDLLKQLKKRQPNVPVIMLSANSSVELVEESRNCGAQDYLIKGNISGKDFARRIQEALA